MLTAKFMSQSICLLSQFSPHNAEKKKKSEDNPDAALFQQLTNMWVGSVGAVAYKHL